MEEDAFPAAEKILSDIESVIKKDVDLQSFEIIPIPNSENLSPVHHTEHSLGLASWCVQPLYTYTFVHLMDLRHNRQRREEPAKISRWLMGALLLNPDVCTFWNMRKELFKNQRLDFMEEARFTKVVLFNKSKCFEAFAYRRWLLNHVLVDRPNPTIDVESILRNEISVTGMAADRYESNYNAWIHRKHIIGIYEELCPLSLMSLLISEWEFSKAWCSCHVSDHGGFAYRQIIIRELVLLDEKKKFTIIPGELEKRRAIILNYVGGNGSAYNLSSEELLIALHGPPEQKSMDSNQDRTLLGLSYWVEDAVLNQELINLFPGHEALWCHRKFLVYKLRAITSSYRKHGAYRSEYIDGKQGIIYCNNGDTLLELAFEAKTTELTDAARKTDDELHIVDKFLKFMGGLSLED